MTTRVDHDQILFLMEEECTLKIKEEKKIVLLTTIELSNFIDIS